MENTQNNRPTMIIVGVVVLVVLAVVVGMLTGIIPGPGAASATHQVVGDCEIKARGNCDGDDLSGTWFNGAPVRNWSCNNCNLANTTANGTNWSGSSFQNTNWTGANTVNAQFSNVDLSGSNITQEQINQSFRCNGAILPAGVVCP